MNQRIIIKDDAGHLGCAGGLEDRLRQNGYHCIVGVDEAGRGPLAGPVVAAAVVLPEGKIIAGLQDSKKLSPARRDLIFDRIVSSDAAYAIGIEDNEIIDSLNILRASLRAMAQAVHKLQKTPDVIIVDGNQTIPSIKIPQMAVVGGDACCLAIAAASILAKVTRDRIMDHYARLYPLYAFNKHRGYPTAGHLQELREFGPTPIHRKSFRPVHEAISQLDLQLTP